MVTIGKGFGIRIIAAAPESNKELLAAIIVNGNERRKGQVMSQRLKRGDLYLSTKGKAVHVTWSQ